MSKVYVVVANGDNGAKYIEDYAGFTINIAVFTSKDLAEAFLKYPPALEEACIKHDVIDVDDREGHKIFAEWTTDDNGQVSLTTTSSYGYGDDFDVTFDIEEFELGEYEAKEEKFRPVPYEGSEAQKIMHDISKGIIVNESKDPVSYPGYSPWGDYDFSGYRKEEEHDG